MTFPTNYLTFKIAFLNLVLSHLELLDFARRRRREFLHEAHVSRDLEMRDLQVS